jgi:glycosyltransferase involved in cell wall biosynthesis
VSIGPFAVQMREDVVVVKVLMFLSSRGCGLTFLCAQQAMAFGKSRSLHSTFVSDTREQEPGLLDALAQADRKVHLITNLDDHREFTSKARQLREVIASVGPDVIHVQTNWQLALAVRARLSSGNKPRMVYTIHSFRHNSPMKAPLARMAISGALLLAADRVITPSSYVYARFAVLGARRVPLYLGIDEEYFLHPKICPCTEPRTIIFAGEFRPGKNQEWLIRATAQYIRRTGDGQTRLILLGHGSTYSRCRDLANSLGIAAQVHMPGVCSRASVLAYYASASCAVIATNAETFGYCIVEPYCLGVPVLSRPVGVARDIIRHGETGWLFNTQSELADLLTRVLPDEIGLATVSRNAFANRHLFSWDRIRGSYEQMIIDLVNGRQGGNRLIW